MSLAISCESCSKKFQADDKLQGKTVKCPNCGSPISISAPATPNIGDLLDDEIQLAPPEEAAPGEAKVQGAKCRQCGDELPIGTRYCVVCGCNNFDTDVRVAQIALDLHEREKSLEARAKRNLWLKLLTRLRFWD